jgi:hypothetical protein
MVTLLAVGEWWEDYIVRTSMNTHNRQMIINNTTPSPMPSTMAMWFLPKFSCTDSDMVLALCSSSKIRQSYLVAARWRAVKDWRKGQAQSHIKDHEEGRGSPLTYR